MNTGIFRDVSTIINATKCFVERPADYEIQKVFYFGKKKKHTLKYEVGVHVTDGYLV